MTLSYPPTRFRLNPTPIPLICYKLNGPISLHIDMILVHFKPNVLMVLFLDLFQKDSYQLDIIYAY